MEFMNNQNRLRICIMQNSQTVFCVGFTIPFFLNNHFRQFSMTCFSTNSRRYFLVFI